MDRDKKETILVLQRRRKPYNPLQATRNRRNIMKAGPGAKRTRNIASQANGGGVTGRAVKLQLY